MCESQARAAAPQERQRAGVLRELDVTRMMEAAFRRLGRVRELREGALVDALGSSISPVYDAPGSSSDSGVAVLLPARAISEETASKSTAFDVSRSTIASVIACLNSVASSGGSTSNTSVRAAAAASSGALVAMQASEFAACAHSKANRGNTNCGFTEAAVVSFWVWGRTDLRCLSEMKCSRVGGGPVRDLMANAIVV
jgi:hypothetical protein